MRIKDGIVGLCVGDALGVPAEFSSREALRKRPIAGMTGYGTHNQPPGTWSDDASLTLCLLDSLADTGTIALHDIADKFVGWLREEIWTPHGEVFDIGIATRKALFLIAYEPISPALAGGADEFSNGNGSLMRILPLAYYFHAHGMTDIAARVAHVSSVTHRHPISIIGCVYYVRLAMSLLEGRTPQESCRDAAEYVHRTYADEPFLGRYERLLGGRLSELDEREIFSSGYVAHTLEASVWCLLTTDNYADAVLRAVNLGDDTDTTGAVTGGLAGILYGYEQIPAAWRETLVRREEIEALCARAEQTLSAGNPD